MVEAELSRKSPLRILENSIHGGVGEGKIGVFASRKGVGKTACLVHVATDTLMRGKHVIHVSFKDDPRHILEWYEDIFSELARRNNLEHADDVHERIVSNRIIMNFKQNGIHITGIENSIIALMKNANFHAETLVVDGYDFSRSSIEEMKQFKQFCTELKLELWFSATIKSGVTDDIPPELKHVIDEIDVLITLQPEQPHIHLHLMKDHGAKVNEDLHLKLDPQILLIDEEA
jgi:hypothetical protein